MALSRRRVSDSAALKALAHPLRLALLEILITEGPRTASEAAVLVDESPSNCSWHLRKLAEHGFVREAPGGTGRNRPWRAVSEGLVWGDGGDGDEDAETSAAGEALTDMLLERELQRLRAARASAAQEPAEWRDATTVNESKLWRTAEEAKQLSASMVELFLTHADRLRDPAQRPEGARLVSLVGWIAPSGPYRPERSDSDHQRTNEAGETW
jgi:DNA-binding transcriptional ArsR family regulator